MDVLCPVELWRAARTNAIRAKSLYGFLLNLFVGVEIIEVVRGKVDNSATAGESNFGTRRSTDEPRAAG